MSNHSGALQGSQIDDFIEGLEQMQAWAGEKQSQGWVGAGPTLETQRKFKRIVELCNDMIFDASRV